jgi:hypothetical protein
VCVLLFFKFLPSKFDFVLQGHPGWKKLKDGWPAYLPELDRMFLGIAIDGTSTFVLGHRSRPEDISSDEDDGQATPLSTGTKRSSSSLSTHNTGTSSSKKSKSPAVKNMNRNMEHLSVVLENRTAMMRQALAHREKEQRDKREATLRKIQQVLKKAEELGVDESKGVQWMGVIQVTQSDRDMDCFLSTEPTGQLTFINFYVGVDN